MDILTLKSLHIIFVVSWFAGLFYMVRLFIYHVEAQSKAAQECEILSRQFIIMQKKLWWIITTPAMILAIVFGTWMIIVNPSYLYAPWMQIKLGFVSLLIVYHFICQHIMNQFRLGVFKWKSGHLRLWNELATLFLVAIVFLVVLKSTLNWITGTVAFFLVGIVLMMAVKLYKRLRARNEAKN
ncbi:MAG: CopD family protein [Bacteroidota bacterium]